MQTVMSYRLIFRHADGRTSPTNYPPLSRFGAEQKARELNSGLLLQDGRYVAEGSAES